MQLYNCLSILFELRAPHSFANTHWIEKVTLIQGCCYACVPAQGKDKGKGDTDGTHRYKTLFSCPKDCGIFAPFSRVRPVVPSTLSPSIPEHSPQLDTEELTPGDRVTYFTNDKCRHGMVVELREEDGKHVVRISTVSNVLFFNFNQSKNIWKKNNSDTNYLRRVKSAPFIFFLFFSPK